MLRALALLLGLLWAGAAAAQTIAISDYQQTHAPVIQRAAGTSAANVTFDGTYTGTAPTQVWIEIVDFTTPSTVIQTWTQCPSPTISGGVWSGCTISVPASSNWVSAKAGENSSSPSIVSGVTPTAFGVGAVFVMAGDSLTDFYASKRSGSETPALNSLGREWCTNGASLNAGAVVCQAAGTMIFGWSTTNVSNLGAGFRALVATIQPKLNMPVGIFSSPLNSSWLSSGGASTATWSNFCSGATCGPWGNLVANLTTAGLTDFEGVIWYQGGQDARAGSPNSAATILSDLQSLYTHLLAQTPRSRTQMVMLVDLLGPETATSGHDTGFENYRQAMQNAPGSNASTYNFVLSSSATDLNPDSDGVHPNAADYQHTGFRDGQTILNYYGLTGGTFPGAGPSVSSATFDGNGTLIRVTLTLNGSSHVTNSSGSQSTCVINGWVVTDSGGATLSSCAFNQPNTVWLTMSQSMPPGDTVTLAYMQGENPLTCTTSSCPDSTYGDALPGADTLGLPLLPTVGSLTLSTTPQGARAGRRSH